MQWTSDADAKLFMLVLKIHAIKIDYAGLSLSMSKAMGAEVTPKAITHRIQKLRSMAGAGNSPGSDSNLGSIPTPSRRVSAKQRAASASQPTSTTPSTPTPSAKTKTNSASHAPANPSSLGAGAGSKRARVAETGSPLAKEVNYDSGESANEDTTLDTEDAPSVGQTKYINAYADSYDYEEEPTPEAKKSKYSKSLWSSRVDKRHT